MAGEAMVESTEAEKLAAVLAGMGGGRLPPSFSSVDAEMYAILAYLSKVCELKEGETEASLADKRVLIMCDCAPCLKALERACPSTYLTRERVLLPTPSPCLRPSTRPDQPR